MSELSGALKRLGSQLSHFERVEADFFVEAVKASAGRVYGVIKSHDAAVQVGFDVSKVQLPDKNCRMRITGKPWLNQANGGVTIMATD